MDDDCQRKRIARTEERSNGETDQRRNDDLARMLPDDVLADVLRRLAPRWLAACRCVCKAWRALVDARRLLRADLLPLWLDGIIVDFERHEYSPEFFSRHSLPLRRKLENLTAMDVRDHCNGLLLSYDTECDRHGYVSNPATGWKVRLPPCPPPRSATEADFYAENLVFDPTVSTHYEVFKIPYLDCELKHQQDPLLEKSEWPPSQFVLRVFSSVTGTWEERTFDREGEAAGKQCYYAYINSSGTVYWRGALYVACVSDFIMRIRPSVSTYRVIKAPLGIGELYLGRSEKGVYVASLCDLRIQVWILNESRGHLEWLLKHDNNLNPVLPRRYKNHEVCVPWFLQAAKGYADGQDILHDNHEALSKEKFGWNFPLRKDKFEWNSDGDDVTVPDDSYMSQYYTVDILGFHPYKEIVFLSQPSNIGLAYHLSSSRFQLLGSLYPANDGVFLDIGPEKEINISLPYTPCWIEELPGNN